MKEQTNSKKVQTIQDPNIRKRKILAKVQDKQGTDKYIEINEDHHATALNKKTSMSSLITWNISKAFEKNPSMDLKSALRKTQLVMESKPGGEITAMTSQAPAERHLLCALLAWLQLGHQGADSLTQFAESKQRENVVKEVSVDDKEYSSEGSSSYISRNYQYFSKGPLMIMPAQSKVVMHAHTTTTTRPVAQRYGLNMVADCCKGMKRGDEKATVDLRRRAAMLASREAKRAELLERAEMAWRDLELGYERRLRFSEEKEEMFTKQRNSVANCSGRQLDLVLRAREVSVRAADEALQPVDEYHPPLAVAIATAASAPAPAQQQDQIPLLIKERDSYKSACGTLIDKMKEVSEFVCGDRGDLKTWESKVFDLACERHALGTEAAQADSKLYEQQCKAAQIQRDYQEIQVKRKVTAVKSDMEAARILRQDTEKGFRNELGQLKIQIQEVSNHLLKEDPVNAKIKETLADIRLQKKMAQEELEILIKNCDGGVRRQLMQLQQKRRELMEEQAKAVDCRCKVSADATVQAKRTPSLAALCHCNVFEGKYSESCSCTSLRTKLLSDLFSDLFSGLQEELGGAESLMPCQMLNCLHDDHNWDRAGLVKTNLHKFFSKLLMEELDIAIATSIEKYRAKWVGRTCEDEGRLCPATCKARSETWQKQEVERRALVLAEQFAEDLLQKQAHILRGKNDEPNSSKAQKGKDSTILTCQVNPTKSQVGTEVGELNMWARTQHDVTQLRLQMDPVKKEITTKVDCKKTNSAQRNMDPDNCKVIPSKGLDSKEIRNVKVVLNKSDYADQVAKFAKLNTLKNLNKTKPPNTSSLKKHDKVVKNKHLANKICNRAGQTYAVNVCICEGQNNSQSFRNESKPSLQQDSEKMVLQVPSNKKTKPISQFPIPDIKNRCSKLNITSCHCFNKTPSTSSIDELLKSLIKWKESGFPPLKLKDNSSNIYSHKSLLQNKEPKTDDKPHINNSGERNTNSSQKNDRTKIGKKNSIKTRHDNLGKNIYSTTLKDSIINALNKCLKEARNSVSKPNINEYCDTNKQSTEEDITVSASEYMGAINLDKSYCKCIHTGGTNLHAENIGCCSKYGFKCINDDICSCEYNNDKTKYLTSLQNSSFQTNVCCEVKSKKDKSITDRGKVPSLSSIMNNTTKRDEGTLDDDIKFINCDNKVKISGVVLPKYTEFASLRKSCENSHDTYISIENSLNNKMGDSQIITDLTTTKRSPYSKVFNINRTDTTNQTICQCSYEFENLKVYLDNLLAKYNKKPEVIEDKGVDAQSFKEMRSVVDKSCPPCLTADLDESQDLEINAFALLKEHLKEKIEEIKISANQQPCVFQEDEEKLVSSILNKVKQVISESTKANTCKCKDGLETKGSWDRAYALLQEYLKTKIKRVKCFCASSATESEILPNILDKVCSLIENDFERLKNKNKITKLTQIAKYVNEIPEKDENCLKPCQKFDVNNIKEGKYPIRKTKLSVNNEGLKQVSFGANRIINQNISSQVSRNYFTKTTSCEPITICLKPDEKSIQKMEAGSKNVTAGIGKSHERFDNGKVSNINACYKVLGLKNSDNCDYNVQQPDQSQKRTEFLISECLKLKEDNTVFSVFKTPYVGCTVACSCDLSLGACVCSKSAINNDKIKDLLNNFVAIDHKNEHDYIMTKSLNQINKDETLKEKIKDQNISTKTEFENIKSAATAMVVSDNVNMVLTDSTTCNFGIAYDVTDVENSNEIKLLKQESNSKLNMAESQSLIEVAYTSDNCSLKSEIKPSNDISEIMSECCDCKRVPICQVKMLVENIENSLAQSQCVCDSMNFKVCPVHSKNTREFKDNIVSVV